MSASEVGVYALLVALIGLVLTANNRVNNLAVKLAEIDGETRALSGKLDGLHGEMQAEFAKIRQELADRGSELSGEISQIRERLARLETQQSPA